MIYLLHSTVALGTTGRNASNHYIGYCEDGFLWQRMVDHVKGHSSAAIVRAFREAGAMLYLVRIWPDGGRGLERHLKDRGHYKAHCPICQGYASPENSVSIEAVSALTMRRVGLRSRKQMREALNSDQSGTLASMPGLLVQTVIQVPNTFSGSDVGVTLGTPGGRVSPVRAPTKPPADRSAGTKQPSSVSGKMAEFDSILASQRKNRSGSKADGGMTTSSLPGLELGGDTEP